MLFLYCEHRKTQHSATVMILSLSDSQAWANSADPDQRSSLIRVYTVCHSVCIVWTHYSMVGLQIFWMSEYLGNSRYLIADTWQLGKGKNVTHSKKVHWTYKIPKTITVTDFLCLSTSLYSNRSWSSIITANWFCQQSIITWQHATAN